MNPDRELIAEMNVEGGLKLHKQKIYIHLLKKTESLPSKVVIKHGIHNGESFTEEPRTIRFESYVELLVFKTMLLRAIVKKGKEEGMITGQNVEYLIHKEKKEINKAYRGTDRENVI